MVKSPVNIAILSSRESLDVLVSTVQSAVKAVPMNSIVDVVINGNNENAKYIVQALNVLDGYESIKIFIWFISKADKENAWNTHIHQIWRSNDQFAIYIDGYVKVDSVSIDAICNAMSKQGALGGTGLPSIGRSAKAQRDEMVKNGGFHGNFCGLTQRAMEIIRANGIRIPIGMYRVDSVMGAYLSFGLDNINNEWRPKEYIKIASDATWQVEKKHWYKIKDIVAAIKRKKRQAKGGIENLAIKYYLVNMGIPIQDIPVSIEQIISRWHLDNFEDSMRKIKKAGISLSEFENMINTPVGDLIPGELRLVGTINT